MQIYGKLVKLSWIPAAPSLWQVEVGSVKDPHVLVLLGWDWPGFAHLLSATVQPSSSTRGCQRCGSTRPAAHQLILLATYSERAGELQNSSPSLYMDLFLHVTAESSFGREQWKDERLQ